MTQDQLEAAVLQLPASERARLAERLIASLDEDAELEVEWQTEAERRDDELRSALAVTQEELADRLSIAQSNVSRLERRDDMLLSTLREVVRALGGELKVTAVFPEGTVEITQFLGEREESLASRA